MRHAVRNGRGASSVEYALIVSLIAFVVVGGVAALGGSVAGLYSITF